MDLTKAQHLLLKIQTFLEMGNGHELSRLEKDLMKSYIVQLYDAVSEEDLSSMAKTLNQMESNPKEEVIIPKVVTPQKATPPKAETASPASEDYGSSNIRALEVKAKALAAQPTYVAPEPEPVIEQKQPSVEAPREIPAAESVETTPVETKPVEVKGVASEDLVKLFELSHPKEMDSRFSHVPVEDIASALGLNERIFTLNVLFGGDRELFDNICAQLNQLNSFSEATDILLGGPARKYNWADRESVKMAEHFIRTVARRYPHA